MKKKFKLSLVAKNTSHIFKEELGPGILATQEFEFDLEPEKYESPLFVRSLIDLEQEFLDHMIEVKVEEIEDEVVEGGPPYDAATATGIYDRDF